LAGEGLYAREFSWSTNSGSTLATITASVQDGLFDEITDGYAYSVRAWARYGTSNPSSVGIGIKVGTVVAGSTGSGYWLIVGQTNDISSNNLALVLKDETGANVTTIEDIVTVSAETWTKIRMDVTPLPNQDTIEVYTGTGATGSETWTLEHTEDVLTTDGHFTPWADASSGKIGFTSINRVGGAGPNLSWIDRFQVFLDSV
jgi:hypothetical protein